MEKRHRPVLLPLRSVLRLVRAPYRRNEKRRAPRQARPGYTPAPSAGCIAERPHAHACYEPSEHARAAILKAASVLVNGPTPVGFRRCRTGLGVQTRSAPRPTIAHAGLRDDRRALSTRPAPTRCLKTPDPPWLTTPWRRCETEAGPRRATMPEAIPTPPTPQVSTQCSKSRY